MALEPPGTHVGLRAQKTASSGGRRPGVLKEPVPQRSDRSLRRSAGDSQPTLGLPVLAELSGDALEASTVRYFSAAAPRPEPAEATAVEGEGPAVGEQADEEEEEEEEEREHFLEVAALFVGIGSGMFVLLALCGRPRCLAFWWPRSSLTLAAAYAGLVLLVSLLALCSLLSLSGPDARHHGWHETEGQLFSGLVLLVILLLALCFLPCCQAQDACRQARRQVRIMAGMNQKDSYTVGWFCWYCTLRCVPFLLSSGPGCSHHGRYGPEGGLRRAVHKVVFILVVMQRRIPWSHRP